LFLPKRGAISWISKIAILAGEKASAQVRMEPKGATSLSAAITAAMTHRGCR
jgi:hypothetical protein